MDEHADFILKKAEMHHEWSGQSLSLIASENLMSPLARQMLACDFHDKFAGGRPGASFDQGSKYVDDVEQKVVELGKELFKAPYIDPRPISGTVANIAVLFALAKPGDNVTAIDSSEGGHVGSSKMGAVGLRGCNPIPYPWDDENMTLDVDATIKLIRSVKPVLTLFGRTPCLFPTPLNELRDVLQEVGCNIWYDGAHVLGLIAGGRFQDPLREGAVVISGSTHRTLPGPKHGILIANPRDEDMENRLSMGVYPGIISSRRLHSMAALGITLAEHLKFGREYADQTVRNARALAQAMHERGFAVLCPHRGFTESHYLLVDVSGLGGGTDVVERMDQANIIANKNPISRDRTGGDPHKPSGMRLGVQELTRLGMRETQMVEVAQILKRLLINREGAELVRKDVAALRKDYNTIHYCFTKGGEAYKMYKLD